jgi:hypothetical protein
MNGGDSALELAAKRLDRALVLLEQKLADKSKAEKGGLFEAAGVAAELEQAREREKALVDAGAEASAALGRAISEIRAALNGAAQEA